MAFQHREYPTIATDRSFEAARIRRLATRIATLAKQLPHRDRLAGGLEHALVAASAALIAYLPTHALGVQQGFWAAITAISVVQTKLGATQTTARDQFTGAAIGGSVGSATGMMAGEDLASYVLAVSVAIFVCWMLNVANAARLAGVTATIIQLVPHQGSPLAIMISRVAEVAWGVAVAVSVAWVVDWIGRRGRPSETGQ